MLNSDRALDLKLNRHTNRSKSPKSDRIATELSIEQSTAIPIFTDATAQAMRLIDSPVAILSTIACAGYQIGSISGLDRFTRLQINANLLIEFSGLEYCHAQTISSEGSFIISNFQEHLQLAQSSLCQVHGIRAYLGVPIVTAAKDRLGAIAILDFKPRQFSDRDIDLLQLISRLVASEFERKVLSQAQLTNWIGDLSHQIIQGFDDPLAALEHDGNTDNQSDANERLYIDTNPALPTITLENTQDVCTPYPSEQTDPVYPQIQGEIQFKLLTYLAQELRTPLTSVLGMASVLQQQIYGSLSSKQKDYLGIIHNSAQQLVTIVDEIAQLGAFDRQQHQLTLKLVDLEMLCQLAIQSLEPLTYKKQQRIILDLAGGDSPAETIGGRLWLLDKDKVRQIIYYLCLSLIQTTATDCEITIQLSNLTDRLQIQFTTNDPQAILLDPYIVANPKILPTTLASIGSHPLETEIAQDLRISLGLSLSYTLAALHGGKIEVIPNGCGYQLSLPQIINPSC